MKHEHDVVRAMLLQVPGTTPLARAVLGWARPHARWLVGARAEKTALTWRELRQRLAAAGPREEEIARQLDVAARLGEALRFDAADTRVLLAAVAIERCPRARGLALLLIGQGVDIARLVADAAAIEPHALLRAQPVRLGLVHLRERRSGVTEVELGWTLDRLLDRPEARDEELLEIMVGPRQPHRLALADFAGHEADTGLLARLLGGAVRTRAAGVNVLIHGPPGTGKTELARTLAACAGAQLFSVGETDDYDDEPDRRDRVNALKLAHRMLAERGDSILLFDEMEDMIGDAQPGVGDSMVGRRGSKLWVNRMIETNPVPVIWTTNAVDNLDPAIVRRMSFVLHLDTPSRASATAMAERIAREEGVGLPDAVGALVASAPEAASVLRVAMRAGQLAGEAGDTDRAARSLVVALRDGLPVPVAEGEIDLGLFEADRDIAALFAHIVAPGAPADVSLLLTGPPGTGKTGLAHHLARALDRPLLVRRASDLLSKWVGGTEANIAEAFRDAERDGAVLLFDEADSLLFDRSTARANWEVGQVNELLSWLDRHPLPFVAATNHAGRLDPAALRRFVFKLALLPLGPERAAAAFARFFGMAAPASLAALTNLTPGDFAVVRRQLRFAGAAGPEAIVALLAAEAAAKPEGGGRIGF